MKSIVVKQNGGVKVYCSSADYKVGENGQWERIEKTKDEEEQSCFENLIEDIKRKEFEKYLISLLSSYDNGMLEDFTNIQIKISYSTDRNLEMNISNDKNWVAGLDPFDNRKQS